MKWLIFENCVTVIVAGATVVSLYWLSDSFHSLWGLLILWNVNSFKGTSE